MLLVEDHHVVEAFTPDGTDDAFDIRILPWGAWRNENLLDAEGVGTASEVSAVDSVAVTDQVSRCRVPRERFGELSAGPFSRGMLGDVEVNDAPPVMGQHEEHEQDAECNGGHGEEVDGDEIFQMIIEERPPTRARWFRVANHVLGDRRLGQVDTEFQKLAVNPGSAPQRVGPGHFANQIADLGVNRWPATLVSALPSPVVLEALPVPADPGRGLDDDEAFSPSIPGPSQPEPEDPVLGFQPWAFGFSVEDDELLAKGQILCDQVGPLGE